MVEGQRRSAASSKGPPKSPPFSTTNKRMKQEKTYSSCVLLNESIKPIILSQPTFLCKAPRSHIHTTPSPSGSSSAALFFPFFPSSFPLFLEQAPGLGFHINCLNAKARQASKNTYIYTAFMDWGSAPFGSHCRQETHIRSAMESISIAFDRRKELCL